jgi:hypothetical protein
VVSKEGGVIKVSYSKSKDEIVDKNLNKKFGRLFFFVYICGYKTQ